MKTSSDVTFFRYHHKIGTTVLMVDDSGKWTSFCHRGTISIDFCLIVVIYWPWGWSPFVKLFVLITNSFHSTHTDMMQGLVVSMSIPYFTLLMLCKILDWHKKSNCPIKRAMMSDSWWSLLYIFFFVQQDNIWQSLIEKIHLHVNSDEMVWYLNLMDGGRRAALAQWCHAIYITMPSSSSWSMSGNVSFSCCLQHDTVNCDFCRSKRRFVHRLGVFCVKSKFHSLSAMRNMR